MVVPDADAIAMGVMGIGDRGDGAVVMAWEDLENVPRFIEIICRIYLTDNFLLYCFSVVLFYTTPLLHYTSGYFISIVYSDNMHDKEVCNCPTR
jgi:hypothetical protein